ncbi:hypothetical protein [Kitasatospora sp. LaBMicrA B282]|uniref:hypothetical protein n=1 Tax=Kitasatospora sp. LaBMicrA B282 TaxID=3420949 RepID=UPI003D0AC349
MISVDWVPLEKRRRGLTIRSYHVAADGTRFGDSGVVEADPEDVSVYDRHPAAGWPACGCPRCRPA